MSIRRNPLIADLLHRIDFIEKAGTGIRRIRDGARQQDCPEPEFDAGRFVTVTFRPNPKVRPVVREGSGPRRAGEVPGAITDQLRKRPIKLRTRPHKSPNKSRAPPDKSPNKLVLKSDCSV